jgi:hypothetical protein
MDNMVLNPRAFFPEILKLYDQPMRAGLLFTRKMVTDQRIYQAVILVS